MTISTESTKRASIKLKKNKKKPKNHSETFIHSVTKYTASRKSPSFQRSVLGRTYSDQNNASETEGIYFY